MPSSMTSRFWPGPSGRTSSQPRSASSIPASAAIAMRSYCQEAAPCGRCWMSPCSIKSKAIGGNRRCSRPLETHDLPDPFDRSHGRKQHCAGERMSGKSSREPARVSRAIEGPEPGPVGAPVSQATSSVARSLRRLPETILAIAVAAATGLHRSYSGTTGRIMIPLSNMIN
jgi:hypothetical protein